MKKKKVLAGISSHWVLEPMTKYDSKYYISTLSWLKQDSYSSWIIPLKSEGAKSKIKKTSFTQGTPYLNTVIVADIWGQNKENKSIYKQHE